MSDNNEIIITKSLAKQGKYLILVIPYELTKEGLLKPDIIYEIRIRKVKVKTN